MNRLAVILLLCHFSAPGADEPASNAPAPNTPAPQIRAVLAAHDETWAGQRIALQVDLLVPGYLSGVPFFDLPSVPGVLMMPPQGSPILSTEQIDGTSFTVQRHELAVLTRRAGDIAIPPFEVRLAYKRNPLDHDPVGETLKTPPVSFTAKAPPGSRPDEDILTSTDLTVAETWKPVPGTNAKAGDAFVRTLTWSASDLPAMAFPPVQPAPIDRLGLYPATPKVSDTSERGSARGERQDTITYVCKAAGHAEIPAWSVRWWNPEKKEMQHADFPARAIDIAGPPPEPAAIRARHWLRHHRTTVAAGLLAALAASILIRSTRPRWTAFLKRLLPRHLPPLNGLMELIGPIGLIGLWGL